MRFPPVNRVLAAAVALNIAGAGADQRTQQLWSGETAMRTNISLSTALFVSASFAVVSLTLAQRCEAQDTKPQHQAQGQTNNGQAGQQNGQNPAPSGQTAVNPQGGAKNGGQAEPK